MTDVTTEAVETATKRTPGLSYKDIEVEFLIRQLPAVQALYDEGRASRASIQRAAQHLAEEGMVDVAEFVEWAQSLSPKSTSGRGPGRGAIQPGESRTYKVQDVQGTFIRLPVPTLGKGMSVPVELSADGKTMVVHLDQATAPVVEETPDVVAPEPVNIIG